MEKVVKEVRVLNNVEEDEVVDIVVFCDGIWVRRGFQFFYGMVFVIDV